MKKDLVIGILGGMGTYATIHLFQQYAEIFPAEKEWERPRIIIDNRCTMPSRVRAFLYNENVEELVDQMADSMQGLIKAGCNRIILACNTSHLFLPKVFERVPKLETKVVNIIQLCVSKQAEDGVQETYLLGSEGTIESQIYQRALEEKKIKCQCPRPEEYSKIRECIEAVKQNHYSETVKDTFLSLVNQYDCCTLGCTELPILLELYRKGITCTQIYDPILLGLKKLKEIFDSE